MGEVAQDLSVGAPLADPYASAPPAADFLLRDGDGSLQVGPPMREIGDVSPFHGVLVDTAAALSLGPHLDDAAAAAAASSTLVDPASALSIASGGDESETIVLTAGDSVISTGQLLREKFTHSNIEEDDPDYLVVAVKGGRGRTGNGKPLREVRRGAKTRRGGLIGAKDGSLHPTL